ncbi:MAG: transcriptional regulator [Planctomycetota bacterium]|jgi:hypothetical protein
MKLEEVRKILAAEPADDIDDPDLGAVEVSTCHASDLISDVLAFRGPGSLLLTGLTNAQVVRTAEILDFVAICFVRGKKPQPETVELAREKGIRLLATPFSMHESCGRLYAKGLPPGGRMEKTEKCQKPK